MNKIEPCKKCGTEKRPNFRQKICGEVYIQCSEEKCGFTGAANWFDDKAIGAWNRMEGKESCEFCRRKAETVCALQIENEALQAERDEVQKHYDILRENCNTVCDSRDEICDECNKMEVSRDMWRHTAEMGASERNDLRAELTEEKRIYAKQEVRIDQLLADQTTPQLVDAYRSVIGERRELLISRDSWQKVAREKSEAINDLTVECDKLKENVEELKRDIEIQGDSIRNLYAERNRAIRGNEELKDQRDCLNRVVDARAARIDALKKQLGDANEDRVSLKASRKLWEIAAREKSKAINNLIIERDALIAERDKDGPISCINCIASSKRENDDESVEMWAKIVMGMIQNYGCGDARTICDEADLIIARRAKIKEGRGND